MALNTKNQIKSNQLKQMSIMLFFIIYYMLLHIINLFISLIHVSLEWTCRQCCADRNSSWSRWSLTQFNFYFYIDWLVGWFMVFDATFNNISVISCGRSVLLVEKTGVPGENHDLSEVTDKLYHIIEYTSPWTGFELTTLVVIDIYFTCSCNSNYHTITITTSPIFLLIKN